MIVRKTNLAGSHLRGGSGATVHAPLPNNRVTAPEHRSVGAKVRNQTSHHFADAGRVVFVGVTIPGLGGRGTVALPFIYQPFHSSEVTDA